MRGLLAVSDVEVFTMWWISVGVVFVVCIVATGLLQNILVVARNIDTNVHEIWTVGKRIANNTVELWLLNRVVSIVKDIRDSAYRINDVAATIAGHAGQCRHCPACAAPAGRYVESGLSGRPAWATPDPKAGPPP